VKSIGPDYNATADEKSVVLDEAAGAAWEQRVADLEKALRAATDVPDEVGEQMGFGDLWGAVLMPAYRAALEEKKAPDWAKIDAAVNGFMARWPKSDTTGLVSFYVSLKKASGVTDEVAVLQAFAASPNPAARNYVAARLRFFELSKKPLEMAFTAIDGREVDLAKLRGKVVLIDFWATWCGPCIEEVPNVKAVFAKYHDQGFEVVSISLDSEKDRQKFIDLVAKESVSWPQYFDGKGWKNRYAVEYTITGIPAMFLIDQTGLLVTTNARGPKLESEVKRLLKL
jgi:thiol-disulfide isomerase/thioredoxin